MAEGFSSSNAHFVFWALSGMTIVPLLFFLGDGQV